MIKKLCCLLFLLLVSLTFSVPSQARTPLVQPGKKTLYQRLVTHPNAKLYSSSTEQTPLREVRTFTVMYIYDQKDGRYEVGVNSTSADGWIAEDTVTVWPQALTMLFTDRISRDPVLFFRDHAAIEATCTSESVAKKVRELMLELQNNPNKTDLPVIASEPFDAQVAENNFYLMPVLNIDNRFQDLKLLEVASIDPGIGEDTFITDESQLKIGFAFVIDTTISMGPYIQQTVDLIRHLYNELEKSPYADKMAFAVVAFRSSLERTPALGYTTKVICDFTTVKDRKILESALENLTEATVSTHDINEDSFAGIHEAADKLSWNNYASRIMLMVSDAGPLGANDPYSATHLTPEALADYLRSKKIYLTTVHVQGAKNHSNHEYAAQMYRTLTMQSDNQASYIAINAKTENQGAKAFHSAANILAQSYGKMLQATATGQFLKVPVIQKKNRTPEEEAERIAASTGYAMQLQFFGNRKEARVPKLVKAWIADADLAKLETQTGSPVLACEPAVLLTKSQLSRLYNQIKLLLQASEEAFLNGEADLFGQIKSAAAQMSRDPKQFELHPERNLAENELLDEVLSDLPYKSFVSSMTQQDWESMSTGSRQNFVGRLKALLARYEEYDKDATHWESFGATNSNDWVYRVPLSMLP